MAISLEPSDPGDDFEKELLDEISSADTKYAEEYASFSELQMQFSKYSDDLSREALKQSLGTFIGQSVASNLQALREQLAILDEGIILAKGEDPNAIAAGKMLEARAAYLEEVNLDKSITEWLDALKSKEQISVENFILGKKRPPKIAKAEENIVAFESLDFREILAIYYREYQALYKIYSSTENGLAKLLGSNIKEIFAPSQPDRSKLSDMKKQMDLNKQAREDLEGQLEKYRGIKTRVIERLSTLAGGKSEALFKVARDMARDEFEKGKTLTDEEIARTQAYNAAGDQRRINIDNQHSGSTPGKQTQGQFRSQQTAKDLERMEQRRGENAESMQSRALGQLKLLWNAQSTQERLAQNGPSVDDQTRQISSGDGSKESLGTATKIAGKGAGLGLKGLLALAPDGLSKVALAALALKDKISALIPDEWKNLIKRAIKIGGGAATAWLISLFSNFLVGVSTMIGAGLGILIGIPLGPAGMFAGGFAGGASGYFIGNSLFGGSSTISIASGAPIASGATVGGMLSGGAGPVVLGVGGTLGLTMFTAVVVASGFVGEPQGDHLDQETRVIFEVTKEALPKNAFPEYTVGPQDVQYKINITASEDITITSITDATKLYGKENREENLGSTDLAPQDITLKKGETKSFSGVPNSPDFNQAMQFSAAGANFKDTAVVNTVTVEAETAEGKQVISAVETVVFGESPLDQPYGYPLAATVKAIDGGRITANGRTYNHCGTFLYSNGLLPDDSKSCIPGGLDLAAVGGTEVRSTIDGTVVKVGFDKGSGATTYMDGNTEKPCPKVSSGSKYTCWAVGGYVYIQDKSGSFVVAYLHLNEPTVPKGPINRGDVLGTVYPGTDLPTSTGPHIHYQVLLNGVNYPFANSTGPCKQGKLLPLDPPSYPSLAVGAQIKTAGPFECN